MSQTKANAGYLLQFCGSCLAIFAFFCLPYLVIHGSFSTALQLAIGDPSYGNNTLDTTYNAFRGNFLYWVLLILAGSVAITAGMQASQSTRTTVNAKAAIYLCIPSGIVLFFLCWSIASASLQGQALATEYSSGYWASVIGLLLIMAGGVLADRLE